MPTIRPSADLRNSYNEISDFCHSYSETVFITKNGKGDLAVMSIEDYEKMQAKLELYAIIEKGMEDVRSGNVRSLSSALSDIRKGLE